jgi:hypothetical protein
MKKYEECENSVWMNVSHEVYHCKQFIWIAEHYGIESVYDALEKEKNYRYGEGPLERGAYNYSIAGLEQNFEVEFAEYATK